MIYGNRQFIKDLQGLVNPVKELTQHHKMCFVQDLEYITKADAVVSNYLNNITDYDFPKVNPTNFLDTINKIS